MTTTRQVNLMFTADTKQAQVAIQNLQQSLNQVANMPLSVGKNGAMTAQIKEASLAAMELKTHLASATNASTGTLDFSKLNTSLQASNVSLSQYASKLLQIGPQGRQAFMQLANAVAQSEVPIRKSNAMLSSMMTTLKSSAGWYVASSAVHGVVGAISTAYNFAQDLDESLNNIRIVTGKSAEEMSKFAKSANEAAKALNASTTEYTNASLIYYQQGLSDQQVKERTDVTVKMANVARESSETISNQLTAIWNNFYDGSKSLESYADAITALGAATASSSSEISDGLEKFASVSKTVGLSYEYATAALATVTATTRQSADVVGTAFKTLFARLQDLKLGETLDDGTTLGKYTENLAKVGVQIQDSSGQLKDMDTILDEVAARWEQLDRGQQVALAKGVAGIRQYNTFLSLMSNWDFMEDNLAVVKESGGTLQDQADIYAESWEAAQKQVKASMESLYQNLVDPDFFINLSEGIEKIVSVVDFLMESLGGLSGVLSTISVLLLKTFSNQVTASIRNMATSIYAQSQYGQQQIQQEKSAQIGEMSRMMANTATATGDTSQANQIASNQYSQQLTMQQQLIENEKNMSQDQIIHCQQILDLRKQIGNQIIATAEKEENATQEIKNLYSEMLTEKTANKGSQLNSEEMQQLREHKQTLEDNIRTQDALEQSIKELQMAYEALENAQAQNDKVAEEERQDLTELAQQAENAEKKLRSLIQSSGQVDIGAGQKVKGLNMGDKTAQNMINQAKTGGDVSSATLEARAKAINNVTQAENTLNQVDGISETTVKRLTDAVRNENEAQRERNNLTDIADDLQEKYNTSLDRGKSKGGDWAKSITAGAQGLMSLVSTIQIASGLIDTLTNPDATGWEKFFAVLSSGSMIIMMVMSAMSSFTMMQQQWQKGALKNALATGLDMAATKLNNAVKKEGIGITKAKTDATNRDAAANAKHAASEGVDAGAGKLNNSQKQMGKLGKSFGNFKSAFSKFLGTYGAGIGLIAAGVAVAVGAIAWGINQFKKYENAAKEAAEQAKEAANGYKAVSEAYNAFTSNLDAYKSARDGLKDLTKGTQEYREAVLKANESTMQLLNTHDNLQYKIDSDGLITISEESLKQAQEQQLKQLEDAQRVKMAADQRAKTAQLEKDKADFQRKEMRSSQGRWMNAGNIGGSTGAGVLSGAAAGAGIGMIAGGGVFSVPAMLIGLGIGAAAGLVTGIVGTSSAGSAVNEEEEALNRLAEVYATSGNAQFATDEEFRKLLTEDLEIDDTALINSLVENRESTLDLVAAMAENTAAVNAQNAAAIQSYYGDQLSKSGLSEEGQQAVANSVGTMLDDKAEELYQNTYRDKMGGMTDAEVQKAYAEAMGWATDTIDNQNKNKAKYYDKEGKEVGVISDEVARRYLAEQEALKQLSKATDTVTKKFLQLEKSTNAYDQALLLYLKNKNFSELSEEEYGALYGQIAGDDNKLTKDEVKTFLTSQFDTNQDGNIDSGEASIAGFENGEAFVNDFFTKMNLFEETREAAIENMASYTQSLVKGANNITKTMSAEEIKMMSKQVNQALLASGEDAAKYVANTFYGKAEGEAEKVAKALDGVEWSSVDADDLAKTLAKAGVATKYTKDELNQLIDYMVKDVSKSSEDMADSIKALDKAMTLQQGDTLSSEEYSSLQGELQSYFTLMADGTYQLTQNALDFAEAVKQSRVDLLKTESKLAQSEKTISEYLIDWSLEDYRVNTIAEDARNDYGVYHSYQAYLDNTIGYSGVAYWKDPSSGIDPNSNAFNIMDQVQGTNLYAPLNGVKGIVEHGGRNIEWGAKVFSTDNLQGGNGSFIVSRPKKDSSGNFVFTTYDDDYAGNDELQYEDIEVKGFNLWSNDVKKRKEANKKSVSMGATSTADLTDGRVTEANAEANTDLEIIGRQLELLAQGTYSDDETMSKITDWQTKLQNTINGDGDVTKVITMADAEEIYNLIDTHGEGIYSNMVDQAAEAAKKMQTYMNDLALSAETAREREQMLKSDDINADAYNLAVQAAHEAEKMENLDVASVNEYAKALKNAVYASDTLFDNMSEEAAQDVAAYTMKMNRGIETLASNFDTWNDILRNSDTSSVEFSDSLRGIKEAMSDVLGVQEDFISDNFLLTHMEDIEKAAEGDADAIDRLAVAASKDILMNVTIGNEQLQAEMTELHNELTQGLPDFEVGATINDADFLKKAAKIVEKAGMTAEEANAYFRSMGLEPNFATKTVDTTIETPVIQTITQESNDDVVYGDYVDEKGNVQTVTGKGTISMQKTVGYTKQTSKVQVPAMTFNGDTPDFSFTKTNSGSMNDSSSSNVGGSKSGSSKSKKSSTKKSDTVKRYKQKDDQLKKKQNEIDKVNEAMDRLYGASRLKQMEKQNQLIEEEIELLQQKREEALLYLEEDKKALSEAASEAGVELTIDENGFISNYTEVMTGLHNELTKITKEAEASGSISDTEQQRIDEATQKIEHLQNAIDTYDTTRNEITELDDQITAQFNQWQNNNAKELSAKLELKIEINTSELETLDYYLKKVSDDFYQMAEAAALMVNTTNSTTGTSQLDIYKKELGDYEDQIIALNEAYDATDPSKSKISQADYVEGLKNAKAGLIKNLQSLQELDKSMMDYYGNTLNMAGEEIAKYTERMDHQTSALDHYSSLLSIMGKENDYKTMGKVLEGKAKVIGDQAAVAKRTMEMYKDQAADRLEEYESALASGDSAAAELYLKEYEAALAAASQAEDEYLSKAEEWAEALKAVLENKLVDAAVDLEKALTGGSSFDTLSTQMERANSLQEDYLTTTNKIYETNKMINTAQKEIDKTTNTVAKQKLKNFQQETSQLQNRSKLSQYELDIQQAKYDLLLAEIALEEAQQAKSMVRLRRDSEGNFGYVYTADVNQIAEAEQKLADAQNVLYNKGLEGANEYTQKYQQTLQEMYDNLGQIQEQYLNGEFETEEAYHQAMEEAKAFYYQKLQDYSSLYQIALTTDSQVIADAWSTDFADMTYRTEDWKIAVDDYVGQVEIAFGDWNSQIQNIARDTSLDTLESNIQDITDESENLKNALIGRDGVIDALESEFTAVSNIAMGYATVRAEIDSLITKYEEMERAAARAIIQQSQITSLGQNNTTSYSSGIVGSNGSLIDTNTILNNLYGIVADTLLPVETVTLYASPGGGSMGQYNLQKGKFKVSQAPGSEDWSSSYFKYVVTDFNTGLTGYLSRADYLKLDSLDTGGYTGSWGSDGKLAMLHQKELVLNPDDTTNFLASLEILREIINVIDLHSAHAQLSGLLSSPAYHDYNEPQTLEQQVHIEASFPNVTNHSEIEEAFNNLINATSQYINRK